jgi:hypothetical protein
MLIAWCMGVTLGLTMHQGWQSGRPRSETRNGLNGHNRTHIDECDLGRGWGGRQARNRGLPDATATAIVNSREDWPQQKITVGLSAASLSGEAGRPGCAGRNLSEETQRKVEAGLVATPARLSRAPGFVTQLLTGRR